MATTMTTKYVVATEEGNVEFANLGLVGKFLGKKITKKDLETGKYPRVSLEEVDTEPTTATEDEPTATVEPTTEPEPNDGVEVPDDATSLTDTTDEPELDDKTKRVLDAIAKAINDTPEEDQVLFDALCNLEDAVTDGTQLTDEQATLLTAILTGTVVTQPPTNTDHKPTGGKGATDTGKASKPQTTDPEDDYPEVGDFKDEKAMKKYIKGLSDKSLEEWCILEGVEWKHNEHQAINRMRMAMAIKGKHFPSTAPSKGKKSKSKYASYSTEDLVQIALDNDIEVPDDKGDMRICRMYTIMALRKAGLID